MASFTRHEVHADRPVRQALPTLEPFDRTTFEQKFAAHGLPVLLKGAAAAWPAVAAWTPEYFARRFGECPVTASVNLPDGEVPYRYHDVDYRRQMRMGQFADCMATGDRCYIDQLNAGALPGIEQDFDFTWLGPLDIKAVVFWMGSRTCSGLHYDYADNLFAQILGTKTVILAAPGEARHLHLFPDSHTKSQVSPEHPDLAAHPRFKRATLLEGTLYPGDVLFIPKGWWHYLASSERSISLTCWHGTPLSPRHDVELVMRAGGVRAWGRLTRDFVWNGLLRRPYKRRLFSPPPTGLMLYELLASGVRRPRSGS